MEADWLEQLGHGADWSEQVGKRQAIGYSNWAVAANWLAFPPCKANSLGSILILL